MCARNQRSQRQIRDVRAASDLAERGVVGEPVLLLNKFSAIANGALLPDETTLDETAEALELAQRFGEDVALECARAVHGLILVQQSSEERWDGFELLAGARDAALQERCFMIVVPMIDIELAKEKARTGDCEGAIEMARAIVEDEFVTGEMIFRGTAVATLVESLLQRGTDTDVQEAQTAIERLAAVPTEPGFVLYSVALLRLRALLARTLGDDVRTETTSNATARRRNHSASKGISHGLRRWRDCGRISSQRNSMVAQHNTSVTHTAARSA